MTPNGQHDGLGGQEDINWTPRPDNPDDPNANPREAERLMRPSAVEYMRLRLLDALTQAGFAEVEVHPSPQGRAWEVAMNFGQNPPYQSALVMESSLRRAIESAGVPVAAKGVQARVDGDKILAAFVLASGN